MNNRILILIFAILLGVYLLSKSCGGQSDRSFDPQLVVIDTADISKIILNPSADNYEDVSLQKEGNGWKISKGALSVEALPSVVSALLAEVSNIKAKRIATRNPEKWKDYEVNEEAGNRIRVFAGEKSLADFKVGKFVPNPQTKQFTTYLKMAEDDAVYVFDGYLSIGLGQNFNSFRNNTILDFDAEEITSLDIGSHVFSNSNGEWSSSEGWVADSTKLSSYLNGLKALRGIDFADGFDPQGAGVTGRKNLRIMGNNMLEPIVVTVYEVADPTGPFIINSSLNKNTYFSSDSTGVVSKLFVPTEDWKVE